MKPFLLSLMCLLSNCCFAQYLPVEDAKLNYRLIGFRFPEIKSAGSYYLEIAIGNYTDNASFEKNICKKYKSSMARVLGEAPFFGKEYTWRVVGGSQNDSNNFQGAVLHHFSTIWSPFVDTTLARLRVVTNTNEYAYGYVFTDAGRVLYNMEGIPIWFLPDIEGVVNGKSVIRDLKLGAAGTLTFLSGERACEVNYDGNVLWKAPDDGRVSGDSTEHYHHDFCRLANGHYMILGNEYIHWKVPAADFGNSMVVFDASGKQTTNTTAIETLEFGTIIEYDARGRVVWNWKSSAYFKDTYDDPTRMKKDILQSHENAFCFDEKNQFVYVSFKTPSLILKIKYTTGKVVSAIGKTYAPGTKSITDGTFCEQHSCKIFSNGQLYLFNNNMCHLDAPPGILCFEQAHDRKAQFNKTWEYTYPLGLKTGRRSPMTQGGNIQELTTGAVFASLCSPFGNVFIVDKDKQLKWDAVFEHWNTTTRKWDETPQYRASMIENKALIEKWIWNNR